MARMRRIDQEADDEARRAVMAAQAAEAANDAQTPLYTPEPEREEESPLSEGMTVAADDLSALEGEGWVRLSRVSDQGEMLTLKKVERKILADDLTYIGRTWGGGRYWLEVQNKWRQWVKKFYVNFDEREYGPPKGSFSSRAAAAKGESGGPMVIEASAPTESPMVTAVVLQLQKSLEAKDTQIASLNDRMLTLQMEQNKMVIELMGKMSSANANGGGDFDKIIATADKMIASRGPAPKNDSDMANTLIKQILPVLADGFREFMTKRPAAVSVGVSPESTPLERIAMPFIESLIPAITRGLATQAARPQLTHPPKGQPPTSSQRPATGQLRPTQNPPSSMATSASLNGHGDGEGVNLLDKIKAHPMYQFVAPMILSRAKAGLDPMKMAEEIAEAVPDRFWDAVGQLVDREDMPEYLSLFEPELASHRAWLLAVQKALKENFMVDGGADTDEDMGDEEGGDDVTPPVAPVAAGQTVP